MDYDVDESEDSHLFCTNSDSINITEAIYGTIDDSSKCYMNNKKMLCKSSYGSETISIISAARIKY